MDHTSVWNELLSELEKNPTVSAVALDVFIRTLEPLTVRESNLYLMSETEKNKELIRKNYLAKMLDALHVKYPSFGIVLLDPSEKDSLEDPHPQTAPEQQEQQWAPTKLREDYTFESFIVGKNNQFVHAAAKAIAENPGAAYNPLFIYGNSGLGKTHIMQAIGNAVLARRPDFRVTYVTCNNFIGDFINSIRMAKGGSESDFRARYRHCDMLLIDDIQFIRDKTGTQEELFHTFNDLRDAGKQLVFTSDRPPKEINPLTERLRSRFASGLIADVQPPDYETRVAILQSKAHIRNYDVPQDVLEYIAELNDDNVRTLEENLTRSYFYASLHEIPLSVEIAKEALRDSVGGDEPLDMDTIIDVVCKYYNVSREDLLGKKKTKDIVYYRQMCVYLITEILPVPLAAIGEAFGGRDHTTIIHSRDKIAGMLSEQPAVKTALQDIRNMIYKQ